MPKTHNVHEKRINKQTQEALHLALKHFTEDNLKPPFVVALVVDYLKSDLTPGVVEEITGFVHQFNVPCIPTADELDAPAFSATK